MESIGIRAHTARLKEETSRLMAALRASRPAPRLTVHTNPIPRQFEPASWTTNSNTMITSFPPVVHNGVLVSEAYEMSTQESRDRIHPEDQDTHTAWLESRKVGDCINVRVKAPYDHDYRLVTITLDYEIGAISCGRIEPVPMMSFIPLREAA